MVNANHSIDLSIIVHTVRVKKDTRVVLSTSNLRTPEEPPARLKKKSVNKI